MNRILRFSGAAAVTMTCLITASCRTYTPERVDNAGMEMLPADYTVYSAVTENTNIRWWTAFIDPQMTDLINTALENNLSLKQADARLRQAAAVAAQRGADLLPSISAEGQISKSQTKVRTSEGLTQPITRNEYLLSAACSYELDMWGRLMATRNSASLEMAATRTDMETAAITVTGETALKYLELLFVRERLDLLEQQRDTAMKMLELVELRYRKSQASALDIFQQRESVARLKTLIPLTTAREQTAMNELSLLLGVPLDKLPAVTGRALPSKPVFPQTGIPADLLARRPDIKAAAMRLRGADWSVSAARADMMPALRLTASAGYNSDDFSTLFDDIITRLAANLVGPIFEGGRRRAEVARTRAVVDERLAAYKQTVLRAVSEVQDSIIRESRQDEYITALEEQLKAASQTVAEATDRYSKGAETYLPVLSASISQQNIQLTLVEARYDSLAWRIKLYRALSGDWSGILEDNVK